MGSIFDVQKAMEADGFYPGSIEASGKLQRFKRNKDDKGLSAWSICHQNQSYNNQTFFVAVWGDWHEQGNDRKFVSSFTQLKHDKDKIKESYEKIEKARKEAQEKVWEESSKACTEKWARLAPGAQTTSYTIRKGLSGLFGCKSELDFAAAGLTIIVPLRDPDAKIWGFQRISDDGSKRFTPGTKKIGNYCVVSETGQDLTNEGIIYLAEGFATAASISMALDQPCVCCFDAGNLGPVARVLREKFKDARFVICGDDDSGTEGNPGKTSAEKASRAVLGKAIYPKFSSQESGSDFNDLYVNEGLDVVRAQLSGVKVEVSKIFPLGFEDDTYYYISSSNEQIIPLISTNHTKLKLMSIMPKAFWESQFPAKNGGADYDAAADHLMIACRKIGRFKPDHIRANGVWQEKGGVVVNLGRKLWHRGEVVPLNAIESNYTYCMGSNIQVHDAPLSCTESGALLALLGLVRWKKPEHAKFLAGWLMVAPLCGILKWRPHMWLNGPTGSGKSWIMENVVYALLGDRAKYVLGGSSEAGIRQLVNADAVPIVFDEFETDGQRSGELVQRILELVRQASSQGQGKIVKGTQSGKSMQFQMQGCVLVASIILGLDKEQDKNRFTVVELLRGEGKESDQFKKLQTALVSLPDSFGDRLFARSVHMAEKITANQKKFQIALMEKYNARFGQQYGTLLAGYAALKSDDELDHGGVESILKEFSFVDESEIIQERDEGNCYDHLKHFVFKNVSLVEQGELGLVPYHGDRSVDEIIKSSFLDKRNAKTLERIGMKMSTIDGHPALAIMHKHPEVTKIFDETNWYTGWRAALEKVPGCIKSKTIWFETGSARCIIMPYRLEKPRFS